MSKEILIETVPNISEGRRPEIIAGIRRKLEQVPQTKLLNWSSDADHNRSVFTIVGRPNGIFEAIMVLYGECSMHIDMREHQGAHPCLGAVDVVPLIPLQNTNLAYCTQMAKRLAKAIWERYWVPIYLYEFASERAHLRRLEQVRRGGYAALEARLKSPEQRPDFGQIFNPVSGASIVGARNFLLAFNVNLDTDKVEIAKEIAKLIRTSSGGLPELKALGLSVTVDGRPVAQVSMNFTNFRISGLGMVVDRIDQEARRLGTKILKSELIGLLPSAAIEELVQEKLHLPDFTAQRLIEPHLSGLNS